MATSIQSRLRPSSPPPQPTRYPLRELAALERRALWLSTWLIHNANHLRPSRDGLKVGGHQSSSASVSTLMTALYFHALRPQDRIAVKPHASPMMHAIEYLLGSCQVNFRSRAKRRKAPCAALPYPAAVVASAHAW